MVGEVDHWNDYDSPKIIGFEGVARCEIYTELTEPRQHEESEQWWLLLSALSEEVRV